METIISFVRHGVIESPVYYGRLPGFGLSVLGRKQAYTTALALSETNIRAIFSSPLLRTRQTAEIIGRLHPDLKVRISKKLNEVFSPFDGCSREFIESRNWDVFTGTTPPYEQPDDLLVRAKEFITSILEKFPGQHVLAVTHGDVIAVLILWSLGLPVTIQEKQKMNYPAPCSISTFTFTNGLASKPAFKYCQPKIHFEC